MWNFIFIPLINLCQSEPLPKVDETLAGFKCDAIDKVNNHSVFQFTHVAKGVKIIAVKGNYEEESVDITIKTLQQSDDGYGHLLQHILPEYPSRDYDFKNGISHLREFTLLNHYSGSLNQDRTIYRFTSHEPRSLDKILQFFLDHVFHSKFEDYPESVDEGVRYELESLDSEMKYGGIIMSEWMQNPFGD